MSLINEMLKDLERRRSRDLETSESLSKNITWETRPNQKKYNFFAPSIILLLVVLISLIAYLLWERTTTPVMDSLVDKRTEQKIEKKKIAKVKTVIPNKQVIKAEVKEIVKTDVVAENNYTDERTEPVDVETIDDTPIVNVKKKRHPLTNKQLAEIAYKKGYQLLQKGSMHQGKQFLRDALSLYAPHVKAREMLAGIHIKSGRFVDAAELLSEGIKVVPNYPLFAQLYARVLLEQKNPYLAVKILEKGSKYAAMDIDPDYFALLAATYQRVKKHNEAIDIYFKLVRARPNTGVWWLGLGISLEKTGKNKEALEAYQRAKNTGSLKTGLVKFTNNRVSALKEIGFPEK